MGVIKDIKGQKFNRLLVLGYSHLDPKGEGAVWKCRCDCGNICYVTGKNLRSGNTKSCGCLKNERIKMLKWKDGRCSERLYNVWLGMIRRCQNPNNSVYKYYGGKGVRVCDEWHDYPVFREWALANGYDASKAPRECTIDRINSNGNYEPGNCRWVGMDVQAKNKTFNIVPRDPVTGRFVKVKRDE